ncbi:hypothetical protein BD414DRAFT_476916 [Trametes punicea]|nr:hypothetical protein BD414DRAFT_476916 [Trametes punicea]
MLHLSSHRLRRCLVLIPATAIRICRAIPTGNFFLHAHSVAGGPLLLAGGCASLKLASATGQRSGVLSPALGRTATALYGMNSINREASLRRRMLL